MDNQILHLHYSLRLRKLPPAHVSIGQNAVQLPLLYADTADRHFIYNTLPWCLGNGS